MKMQATPYYVINVVWSFAHLIRELIKKSFVLVQKAAFLCRLRLLFELLLDFDDLSDQLPNAQGLFHADERYRPTAHPKILQAEARAVVVEKISAATSRLRDAVGRYDLEELATILCEAVPE